MPMETEFKGHLGFDLETIPLSDEAIWRRAKKWEDKPFKAFKTTAIKPETQKAHREKWETEKAEYEQPEAVAARRQEYIDDLVDESTLRAPISRIYCASVWMEGYQDVLWAHTPEEELAILARLEVLIVNTIRSGGYVYSFNGEFFDLPLLWMRGLENAMAFGSKLPLFTKWRYWHPNLVDVCKVYRGAVHQPVKHFNLDTAAEVFGVGKKKTEDIGKKFWKIAVDEIERTGKTDRCDAYALRDAEIPYLIGAKLREAGIFGMLQSPFNNRGDQ